MHGEGGWTWENVLNTYKSLENFIPDDGKNPPTPTQSQSQSGVSSGHMIPSFHGDLEYVVDCVGS